MPARRMLPSLVRDWAKRAPTRTLFEHTDGTRLSYGEFHERNLTWAAAFAGLGIGAGERVLTLLPTGVDSYHAWLGLGWLRATEVPLNVAYQGAMLAYAINQSSARLMVVAAEFLGRVEEVRGDLQTLTTIIVPDSNDAGVSGSIKFVPKQEFFRPALVSDLDGPDVHDIACIIYTSGTTGKSKGVLVPWGQLYYSGDAFPHELDKRGAYYSVFPTFHMSGKYALLQPVRHGARLAMRSHFSASAFFDDLRRFDATTTQILPPMMKFLLRQPELSTDHENPLTAFTMAPGLPDVWGFMERFGGKFKNVFGMTEIGGPLATGWNPEAVKSSGRAVKGPPYFDLRIVDEFDHDVAQGDLGQLVVRTRLPWATMAGYVDMPDATAAAWRNGWFHTGDGFKQDDGGDYFFVDRMKDYIRRRGENISSMEVEAHALMHPSILEVAAIGVPSEYGEEEVKIVVVLNPAKAMTPRGLYEELAPTMPAFMRPRFIEFVEALPKTQSTGRVRKSDLKEVEHPSITTWDRERDGIRT